MEIICIHKCMCLLISCVELHIGSKPEVFSDGASFVTLLNLNNAEIWVEILLISVPVTKSISVLSHSGMVSNLHLL